MTHDKSLRPPANSDAEHVVAAVLTAAFLATQDKRLLLPEMVIAEYEAMLGRLRAAE